MTTDPWDALGAMNPASTEDGDRWVASDAGRAVHDAIVTSPTEGAVLGGRGAGSAPRRRVALVAAALLVVGAAGAGALAYAQRDRSPETGAIGSGPRSTTSAPPRSTTTIPGLATCPAIGYPIVAPADAGSEHEAAAGSGGTHVIVDDRSATLEILGSEPGRASFTVRTEAVSPYGTTYTEANRMVDVVTGDGTLPGTRSTGRTEGRTSTTVTWTLRGTYVTAIGIGLTEAQTDQFVARTWLGTDVDFVGDLDPPPCVVAGDADSTSDTATPETKDSSGTTDSAQPSGPATTDRTDASCLPIVYPILEPLAAGEEGPDPSGASVGGFGRSVSLQVTPQDGTRSFMVRTDPAIPETMTTNGRVTTAAGTFPAFHLTETPAVDDVGVTRLVDWRDGDVRFTAAAAGYSAAEFEAALSRVRPGAAADFEAMTGRTDARSCVPVEGGASGTGDGGESSPTVAARATVDQLAEIPDGFQDCGRVAADAGWPTTMAINPALSGCLRSAIAAKANAVHTLTGRTGDASALVTRYRVDAGVATIENWTVDPTGVAVRTVSPCTPALDHWWLSLGATAC